MSKRNGQGLFVRMLSSAVIIQALLSAGSLGVGLILIRNATNAQYGYYVLVMNALLLITSLQNNFISVPMVHRMTRFDSLGRGDLIGGLLREQRQLVPMVGGAAVAVTLLLCMTGVLTLHTTLLVLAAITAAFAALYREFFRMVLLAYRQPFKVMRVDLLYVALLVCGAYFATRTPLPAAVAVAILCLAATLSAFLLSKSLWQHEPWNIHGARGILLAIFPVGSSRNIQRDQIEGT